jgi:asparagine synthetase B (glutamine-hydrolysing)
VRHSRIHPSGWWGRPRAIVHCGPDEQDVYESQNVSREPVQLKIVHLAAKKQPMRTENRNTILVLNGEIQNRQEPRWELEQAPYTFNRRTGTEVVLRVFRAWDVKSLGREAARTTPRAQRIEMEQCSWLLCLRGPSGEGTHT